MTPRGARTFARGRSPGGRRCCGAALSGASRPPRPSPRGAKVTQMDGTGSPAPCGCSSGFRSAPHRPLPPQNRLDPIFEAGAADTRSEQRRAEAEHRSSSRDGFGPPAIERRPKSVSHFLTCQAIHFASSEKRLMDPSPLVPGTLAGLELFIYWEKRPLCRSKQSLVSRSHSVYGPAAERTITGDSFLRCRPLTSRRLRQPLRGHGIPIPRTWECPA